MRLTPRPAFPLALLLVAGCAQLGLAPNEVDQTVVREDGSRRAASHIVVQHVLIAQAESGIPGVTRTIDEAERLAQQVLAKARAGESFDALVRLYGDDRKNDAVIPVANYGVSTEKPGEVSRAALVRGFGDAAFALEVGAIVLVPYDADRSPFGFHVLTRLQ